MRVIDRIRALHDAGDGDSARHLAREVVRNRSDVSASLSDGELVVSVPGFTGRHEVSVRADGTDDGSRAVVDVERGTYRLDDGPAFEVTVHSLWDDAEEAAVPVLYAAVRERGFESLHTLTYAAGRSEVRYSEEQTTDAGGTESPDGSSTGGGASGVLRSVRQLIR